MRARIGVAAAVVMLTTGGVAGEASAAESASVDLSPCVVWGDVLPVELSRGTAREAIFCLVNEERAAVGLPALDRDRRLQRASQRHTARMDGTGCFSHQCPGERSLERRLRRYLAGRPRRYRFGEAIAWQPSALASPRQIVDQLMDSPQHRYHLLNGSYDEVGVGFTVGTPQSALASGGIYTLDFGMRIG